MAVGACPSYAPEAVAAGLAEILAALGGLNAFIKPGHTVLLKPNLLSPRAPDTAVTTHPEVVRQMILLCAKAGAGRIWVGDSPAGLHAEQDLYARTEMTAAVAGTPAELKSWQTRQMPVTCGEDTLTLPEWYAEVDVVISLAKLKTHSLTTMTCALKNVYGLITGQAKAKFHAKYPSPRTMSAFLVRVFATLKPQLTIADAVVAMEGHGPANGRPLPVGVLLASRDAVALDTVACTALRIAPTAVAMIRLAAAQGLGCMEDAGIERVGSGLAPLGAARMKPSMANYLQHVPEPVFNLMTRWFQLRPVIQNRLCVKCGICAGICPRHVIAEAPRTGYPAIQPPQCILCFCCMESCPKGAIALQLYFGSWLRLARRLRPQAKGN